jgi:apolipoprotein N-acyltransferase
MAMAGLNWNIGLAAWLAPVFLLYYTKNSRRLGFLFLFLCMSLASAISKTGENITGIFILSVVSGLSWGVIYTLPYLIERLLNNQEKRFHSTLLFPAAFVLIEYLYSLKYGMWGLLDIAQYSNLNLIQICSIFGLFGISFLVSWFASVVNWLIHNNFDYTCLRKGLFIYGSVFMAVLLFGQIRVGMFSPQSETVRTAAIIGKTDIHQIADEYKDEIMELSDNYDHPIPDSIFSKEEIIEWQLDQTREAVSQGAKIVVWNEISLVLNQDQVIRVLEIVKKICLKEKAYVLLAFLEKDETDLPKPFNNKSVLVTPEGKTAWEYIKNFGHPMEDLIFNKGDHIIPYVDTEFGRLGNVICADLDMPRYISQAAKNSIDIMLVPSFDWVGIIPYHTHMSAFSAIQFGFSIIRANGKGLTAYYDYQGNLVAKINTLTSNATIIYADLPIKSTHTVYSKIGDIFVFISIIFLFVVIGIRIAEIQKRTS